MKHKMNNLGLCTDCHESISNPICLNCFLKQINHWLTDNRIKSRTKNALIKEIEKEFFKEIYNNPENEIECALCGREEVSVCSYCFFLKVNRILKKLNIGKKQIDEFMEIFNYRQWQEDY